MADLPGVALLGAGIFSKAQYLPLLCKLNDKASLRVVWSRSQEAAEAGASSVKDSFPNVQAAWGSEGLNGIMEDSTIHAVAIVLPAQYQLEYVLLALKAGKHVLQEKPAGPSISDIRAILSYYNSIGPQAPIWAVAENYRFEPGLIEGARLVKNIGDMTAVEVIVELPMTSSSPYYSSQWRREAGFKGGFVLDGGVHFIAGLRMITGCEVTQVSAIARHIDPSLPSPDNVSALFQLDNECTGVLVMSYSCTSRKVSFRVLGSKGTVEVERTQKDGRFGYMVSLSSASGDFTKFYPFAGVEEELAAFVTDVSGAAFQGKTSADADVRSHIAEAFNDVAVIEAMLKSSTNKGLPVHVDNLVI